MENKLWAIIFIIGPNRRRSPRKYILLLPGAWIATAALLQPPSRLNWLVFSAVAYFYYQMEIDLEKLPFDLDFHPSTNIVAAGLITGNLLLWVHSHFPTLIIWITMLLIHSLFLSIRYRYDAEATPQRYNFLLGNTKLWISCVLFC